MTTVYIPYSSSTLQIELTKRRDSSRIQILKLNFFHEIYLHFVNIYSYVVCDIRRKNQAVSSERYCLCLTLTTPLLFSTVYFPYVNSIARSFVHFVRELVSASLNFKCDSHKCACKKRMSHKFNEREQGRKTIANILI